MRVPSIQHPLPLAALVLALTAPATLAAAQGSAGHADQAVSAPSAASMVAADITGREVWSDAGVSIGSVERVVEEKGSGRLHALVSMISMAGQGSAYIVFDLADLQPRNGALMAPVSDREGPIAERYAYEVARYRPVEPERRLATLGTGEAQDSGRGDVGAFEQREKESADSEAGE